MKIKFKSFAIVALALSVGLASCNKKGSDPDPSPLPDVGETKTVSVNINVNPATSRAEGEDTAKDVDPTVSDITLFFVGGGFVQKVETITGLTGTFTVPQATTVVYAIGNSQALSTPVHPVVGTTEADLKKLMMEADKQPDPASVNLSMGQGIGTGATFNASNAATINLMPAVARYEIKKVSANASAVQPLKEFTLSAIYVTNTYRTLGIDYTTLPTDAADIYNAGTPTSLAALPAYLKDDITATAGTSFEPSGSNTYWGYFLSAPVATNGTTLDISGATKESSVPIIVLKITGAEAVAAGPSYAATSYVTVRKLIKSGETEPITALEPGNVYIIDDIAIGGEHLATEPGVDPSNDVTVTVTVKPWTGVGVTPGL